MSFGRGWSESDPIERKLLMTRIQELHLPVYHALCAQLEDALF